MRRLPSSKGQGESVELTLIQGDCVKALATMPKLDCIFADPPDNIGLGYANSKDRLARAAYVENLNAWVDAFTDAAPIVWLSFNPIWFLDMAAAVTAHALPKGFEAKECVQVFTFGQHNPHDFGINHRCLWRLRQPTAPLYPTQCKIASWRQLNGDKRAAPGGRVPGDVFDMQYDEGPELGTVFDFPRVTGNSKQRCNWHPTQLHEELVERALLMSTKPGDSVCDPFAGTGTTGRVCRKIDRDCTLIDYDAEYIGELLAMEPETFRVVK